MDYTLITYNVIAVAGIAIFLAVILFLVAKKFKVFEDPRIDDVEQALPGANCGGCGSPGCRGFAEKCVKSESLDSLFCPVGGNDTMSKVAKILGMEAAVKEPMVAVVRCSGSFEHRKKTSYYNGTATCTIASSLFEGDTGCSYGCLGLGDCVVACKFDAIFIDEKTGLPVVSDEKCTACGACVKACPKNIIELRYLGKKNRRIYVSCINQDKGGIAKKACSVACIGCGKCEKVCKFDAIKIENFKAYIDFEKCKLCRKCAAECPTGAILELNFPPKKENTGEETAEKKTSTVEGKPVKEAKADTEKNTENNIESTELK